MENINRKRESEVSYQAVRAAQIPQVTPTPHYIIERYHHCRHWRLFPKEFFFKFLSEKGAFTGQKHILDFGCGEGVISTQLAKLGARVTGIDICHELIDIARTRARLDGVTDRTQFIVADVMESPPPEDTFEFILCHAALHHVPADTLLPLIASLKPGGIAILVEPIAFSPFLQRLRDVVPISKDASPDERQLSEAELAYISRVLVNCEVTHFNLFGRLSRLFPNRNKIDKGHWFTRMCVVWLLRLDCALLALFPALSRFCGIAVIAGEKPMSRPFGIQNKITKAQGESDATSGRVP